MKKAIKTVFWGSVAICTVAACYYAAYPLAERWRASRFIAIVAQLKPGVTTESQAREALRSYRPEPEQAVTTHWDIASNKTIRATGYEYLFSDKRFFDLQLSQRGELSAGLFFEGGILALKTMSLQKGSGTCCLVLVKEADRAFDESPPDKDAVSVDRRGDPANQIIVNLRPDASDEDRRKAYRLNLSCLSSLSRCDSADSLLRGP